MISKKNIPHTILLFFIIITVLAFGLFFSYKGIQEGVVNSGSTPSTLATSTNLRYSDISNNYDVVFHDDINDLNTQKGVYDASFGSMVVLDQNGNQVVIPYVPGSAAPTYYQPGSFQYSASSYVPNYEDSVYLSASTRMRDVGQAYPTASKLGGFCGQKSFDPNGTEMECGKLSGDQCASASCCVLLGGSKCVSGDELGPTLKANYSDPFVKNKDVYYYQGKCYGNCL